MPITLTDTQRIILANAAARDNLRVLPMPSSVNKSHDAITKIVAELLDDGLLAETSAASGDEIWCKKANAGDTALVITERGLLAIGIAPLENGNAAPPELPPEPVPAETLPAGSKLQTIIALLQRPQGAVMEELVLATAWQKHSVRGAISGALKKKHNLKILSTLVDDRGRVYRIEAPAAEPDKIEPIAAVDDNGLGGRW